MSLLAAVAGLLMAAVTGAAIEAETDVAAAG